FISLLLLLPRSLPLSTLFPYTTLFRSKSNVDYLFRATGSVLKFDGFLKVYEEGKDQKDEDDEDLKHKLPAVSEGETLRFKEIRRSEEHTSELQSRFDLVCRLLLEKKKQ